MADCYAEDATYGWMYTPDEHFMAVGREEIRELRDRHRDGRARRLALRLPGHRDRRVKTGWSSASGSSGPGSSTTRPARSTRSSASAARWFGVERQADGELKFAWQRDWFDLGSTAHTFLAHRRRPARRRRALLDRMALDGTSQPGHYRLRRPALDRLAAAGRARRLRHPGAHRDALPPPQLLIDGKLVAGERRSDVPDPQPGHRRRDRPGAGRHGRGRRRRDRRRPAGVRRDRLVDRPRAPGPLPAPAAPGAARPRRATSGADHGRGRGAGVPHRAARSTTCRSRGCAWVADLAESLRVGDRPRRRRSRWASRAGGRSAASRSAWSPRSRRGTSPPRSTWPRSARRWPPAARWCSSRRRTPRGWPASSAGWPPSTPTCRPACSTSSRRAPTRSPSVLATDPRVDMVSFTGSTATGRAIMAAAAPTLKKVFLELGGKSAAIVLDDADLAAVGGRHGVRRLHPRRPGLRDHHAAGRAAREVRRGGPGRRRRRWSRSAPGTRPTPGRSAAR